MLDIESARPLCNANLQALLRMQDMNNLRICAQRQLNELDICDFMLRMEAVSASKDDARVHLIDTFPESQLPLFLPEEAEMADPINQHFSRSSLPLTWEVKKLCSMSNGRNYKQLRNWGLTHGISMQVRNGHAISRIDFYTKTNSAFVFSEALQADAQLFSLYLHEAACLLFHKDEPLQETLLSPRERECLCWSARGKSSQEIGLILGISHHTVYFHFKNSAAKLNVYGTRHAISKAIALGLIKP